MKTTLLISALAVSLNACAIDSDESVEFEDVDRLSANGMTPADLAATTIPVTAFGQTYANNMAQTASGRAVLTYLYSCAFGAGTSMTAVYVENGQNKGLNLTGSLGLYPQWKLTPPSITNQRNLSSCLLARLNENGYTLTVSLRGPLYANETGETSTFAIQEGAYFGNVFQGTDGHWGACDNTTNLNHINRTCNLQGHCSMSWAGDCATACTVNAAGEFASCTGTNGVVYTPTTVWMADDGRF